MLDRWQIGYKIANRFEICHILGGEGKSGMGIAYVCYDHAHSTSCVLKTFQEKYLASKEAQELFQQEARVWIALDKHAFIVRSDWVANLEGRLFIVLEYITPNHQGRNTLTSYLNNISLIDILKYSIQFCYGMEYAYLHGVKAHRDIKPDNIMITIDGIVKITDFGLAKVLQQQEMGVAGTPAYMAPEQFDGYADMRSDVYAFGITLYQMVTQGMLPCVGTLNEYEQWHKQGKIPDLRSPLNPLIHKCIEKNPQDRYQNFSSLREALEAMLMKETGEQLIPPEKMALDASDLSNKGSALGILCHYMEALDCFDQALKLRPHDVFALTNKGAALGSLGRYQEELDCCDEALTINPGYAVTWNNKGIALDKLGRSQEGFICYEKALMINPGYAEAWYNKGALLAQAGCRQEALTCYDEALRIAPTNTKFWYNKGNVLIELGRYHESLDCFDKALVTNPLDAAAWYNKGVILCMLKRYDEALHCADRAIEYGAIQGHELKKLLFRERESFGESDINSTDVQDWNDKGYDFSNRNQWQEALNCYEEVLKITPKNSEAWYSKGVALGKLGRLLESLDCYDKALAINPRYTKAWNNKGALLGELCRFQEAIVCFDKALEIDPEYINARNNLIYSYEKFAGTEKVADDLYTKGINLMQQGNYSEAIGYFDNAFKLKPSSDAILYEKGRALRKLGHPQEAIKCYDTALATNPREVGLWFNKGNALRDMARWEEAINCYDKALEIKPDFFGAQLNKQNALEHYEAEQRDGKA